MLLVYFHEIDHSVPTSAHINKTCGSNRIMGRHMCRQKAHHIIAVVKPLKLCTWLSVNISTLHRGYVEVVS